MKHQTFVLFCHRYKGSCNKVQADSFSSHLPTNHNANVEPATLAMSQHWVQSHEWRNLLFDAMCMFFLQVEFKSRNKQHNNTHHRCFWTWSTWSYHGQKPKKIVDRRSMDLICSLFRFPALHENISVCQACPIFHRWHHAFKFWLIWLNVTLAS